MVIIATQAGDKLIELNREATLLSAETHYKLPLIFAFVVARYEGKTLFVYNPWRREWELPSGLIDAGETPEVAAARELLEESGQIAPSLTYTGLCLLNLPPDDRPELGAAYTCELDMIRPFEANEESEKIMLWDLVSAVEGHVNVMAHKLAQMMA